MQRFVCLFVLLGSLNAWADDVGDLTPQEQAHIQRLVDELGIEVNVVGSAAEGARRNPGTELPYGKGPGTKSDIDYLVDKETRDAMNDDFTGKHYGKKGPLAAEFPGSDKWGFHGGTPDPNKTRIRFAPGKDPEVIRPENAGPPKTSSTPPAPTKTGKVLKSLGYVGTVVTLYNLTENPAQAAPELAVETAEDFVMAPLMAAGPHAVLVAPAAQQLHKLQESLHELEMEIYRQKAAEGFAAIRPEVPHSNGETIDIRAVDEAADLLLDVPFEDMTPEQLALIDDHVDVIQNVYGADREVIDALTDYLSGY